MSGIVIIWLPNQDSGIFGKRQLKYLLRILAHLWVKRKPCQGYGCLLPAEDLHVVWKLILNMISFFCVPRHPFLKKGCYNFGYIQHKGK